MAPMLAALGDMVEDVVVRLSGPINVAADTTAIIVRRRGGSAANVAVAAARAGHRCRFLGQVGSDAIGDALLAQMAAEGVDVSLVRRSGSTGTIVALVDDLGERSMLTDRRACLDLSEPDPGWLDGVTVLHVPMYSLATGVVATTTSTVIGWAHERGIDVSIDLSSVSVMTEMGLDRARHLLDVLRPDVLLANRDEAEVFGLTTAWPGALTVIKRGADHALLLGGERAPIQVPAMTLTGVSDTTGAGDAFAAGLLTHPGGWRDDPAAACRSGHRTAAALLAERITTPTSS